MLRSELIKKVKSVKPSKRIMGIYNILSCGNYDQATNDWSWTWRKLEELTDYELERIYNLCVSDPLVR